VCIRRCLVEEGNREIRTFEERCKGSINDVDATCNVLWDLRRCTLSIRLLWPARATTKISLAAPRHHLGSVCRMGVPERGGGQKAAYCLNYLATQPLPYKKTPTCITSYTLLPILK